MRGRAYEIVCMTFRDNHVLAVEEAQPCWTNEQLAHTLFQHQGRCLFRSLPALPHHVQMILNSSSHKNDPMTERLHGLVRSVCLPDFWVSQVRRTPSIQPGDDFVHNDLGMAFLYLAGGASQVWGEGNIFQSQQGMVGR